MGHKTQKVVFFTGATSGLGKVAAMSAVNDGAHLVVLYRNEIKRQQLEKDYEKKFPNGEGRWTFVYGDLLSFQSVANACQKVKDAHPMLDQIVLNAGIMNFSKALSVDGIEQTLQVNLLSPMLIIEHLVGTLSGNEKKIIFTSSGLHQGTINFNDLEFKNKSNYRDAYKQSKLGVILMTRLLSKEFKPKNIGVYCQHPGIVRTELGRTSNWFSRIIFWLIGKSAKKGAQTLEFLMSTPNSKLTSGEYYAKKQVTEITNESRDLNMAAKLQLRINDYISPFLSNDTLTI